MGNCQHFMAALKKFTASIVPNKKTAPAAVAAEAVKAQMMSRRLINRLCSNYSDPQFA